MYTLELGLLIVELMTADVSEYRSGRKSSILVEFDASLIVQ
jgi:hypothetical protein